MTERHKHSFAHPSAPLPGPAADAPVIHLVSLGCPKNQVDSERLAGALVQEGFLLAADPLDADLALVNTCAFLESARTETRGILAGLQKLKGKGRLRAVVAAGCYPARTPRIPGSDLVVTFDDYPRLAEICRKVLELPPRAPCAAPPDVMGDAPRLRFGQKTTAYLKISEGCDNRCAYCAIPSIRGGLRSRPVHAIVEEAEELVADGARELVLVAQDTTAWGHDLPGRNSGLPGLVRRLLDVPGYRWLRIMYAHPAHVNEALIELLGEKRVARYLDIPIQHVDDGVLAAMNRPYRGADLRRLIGRLRARVGDIALRTTCLVGFPGETPAAFRRLLEFVAETQFDHLGAFAYSREPGTVAARMTRQTSPRTRARRLDTLMRVQKLIADLRAQERVGERMVVLVESAGPLGPAVGRSQYHAPEVDGKVIITAPHAGLAALRPGRFCAAIATGARNYNLVDRLV